MAAQGASDHHELFGGIDRALVIAALAHRLGAVGIDPSLTSMERCAVALDLPGPLTRLRLYWIARICFVKERHQIAGFDAVFDAIFDLDADEAPSRQRLLTPLRATHEDDQHQSLRTSGDRPVDDGEGLPWTTLPSVVADAVDPGDEDSVALPERAPSRGEIEADKPFDQFDEVELARIGVLLEAAMTSWPTRRTRRRQSAARGDRPDLRRSMRRAMATGGEPIVLSRTRPRHRPRRVVFLVDVSGSMESFARAYLHMARGLALVGGAEVFAFATSLTRITPSLRRRSPTEAIEQSTDAVGDRFGGTRLAFSISSLLKHPRWSSFLRGAVVVISSDGWDTDDPAELAAVMARLHRLAHRVVWVNPRLSAAGFEPLVGAMAAALPHCDAFVSGHSAAAIDDVVEAILAADAKR